MSEDKPKPPDDPSGPEGHTSQHGDAASDSSGSAHDGDTPRADLDPSPEGDGPRFRGEARAPSAPKGGGSDGFPGRGGTGRPPPEPPQRKNPDQIYTSREGAVLLLSVFVVASCGIAYELVIAATGAYIAGDGVTQFSLTIGIYLFSMGIGSYLSRQVTKNLLETFIGVEILVGLVGGFANTILFLVYGFLTGYEVVFYSLIVVVGIFVGLEIPLLIRLLSTYGPLRVTVSNVLSLDSIGALAVAVAFPLVLLPSLGLMRTSILFGLLNVVVAGGNLIYFRDRRLTKALHAGMLFSLMLLVVGFFSTGRLSQLGEAEQYDDDIIYAQQTPFQRIVLTRWRDEVRMYLDRNIQFSSRDEHRYHEALVHPALATIPNRDRILILGGGDGLGLREVLKYPDVGEVVLVDIDEELVTLSRTNVHLRKLNAEALSSPKVRLVYRDAWTWLRNDAQGLYNAVLVDMPDPSNEKMAKLYSVGFYRMIRRHLAADGALVVQSTSPYFAPGAFWCVHETLKAAGFDVVPIRIHVPTFGEWGFNLASHRPLPWKQATLKVPTRYLTSETWASMFAWPGDMAPVAVEKSTLDNPRVIFYYQRGYESFYRSRTGGASQRRRR